MRPAAEKHFETDVAVDRLAWDSGEDGHVMLATAGAALLGEIVLQQLPPVPAPVPALVLVPALALAPVVELLPLLVVGPAAGLVLAQQPVLVEPGGPWPVPAPAVGPVPEQPLDPVASFRLPAAVVVPAVACVAR